MWRWKCDHRYLQPNTSCFKPELKAQFWAELVSPYLLLMHSQQLSLHCIAVWLIFCSFRTLIFIPTPPPCVTSALPGHLPLGNHKAQTYSWQDRTASVLHNNEAFEFRGSIISLFSTLSVRTASHMLEYLSFSGRWLKCRDPGNKPTRGLILPLPYSSFVIWGKLLNLSELQCSRLPKRDK